MNYPFRVITIGEQDPFVVKSIQIILNKYCAGPIVVDGIFGKVTLHAVRKFQSEHCDGQGHPLAIDGLVGLQTWSCLFESGIPPVSSSNKLTDAVIKIANAEIGVCEEPPHTNRGPKVDEYLGAVGLGPGLPWCAAFVYWCFLMACRQLAIPNPLPKTGVCMLHWKKTSGEHIYRKDFLTNPSLIVPGLIFIISCGNGKGHTGIVIGVQDDYILTIEGNSNNTCASEGLRVCVNRRKISTINVGFIKYE